MKWDIESINDTVKWLRDNRYEHEVNLHIKFEESLSKELVMQEDDYLLLKWQKGLMVIYKNEVIPTSNFPLSEIIDFIHSYSDILKESISRDEEYWDERWRDEVLIHLATWRGFFDIKDSDIYIRLKNIADVYLNFEIVAKEKATMSSGGDKHTFRSVIFGSDRQGKYNDCVTAINTKKYAKAKIKEFMTFIANNREYLHFENIKDKDELYSLMMADDNIKLRCTPETFKRYFHSEIIK